MRNRFEFVFVVMFLLALTFSCSVSKNIYFERSCVDVQSCVDSVIDAHSLHVNKDFKGWPKMTFYGNDSIPSTVYSGGVQVKDSVYMFTVVVNGASETFKFRREIQKKR